MKIALLGYGKMGKEIEKVALERGHEIVLRKNEGDTFDGLKNADVAIDFSIPHAAFENISTCIENNIPVVSGTTGWLKDLELIKEKTLNHNGTFLYASNFSIGVNIFFELNKYLSQLMKNLSQYHVAIEEIHHTQKLDAPSGTAITLAEGILENGQKKGWTLDEEVENHIPIFAKRLPDVPGTHHVKYSSGIDDITISHVAHSRAGFALGAVLAAEFICDKKGIFSMKDVLNIQ